jgi:hypothetical protein
MQERTRNVRNPAVWKRGKCEYVLREKHRLDALASCDNMAETEIKRKFLNTTALPYLRIWEISEASIYISHLTHPLSQT